MDSHRARADCSDAVRSGAALQIDCKAEVLEARLQAIRLDVLKGEQDQNGLERAAEYLGRSDPERALNGLQARIASTEQAIQFHQQRNQSGDLIGCVEAVRQQQQEATAARSETHAR